MQLNFLLTLMKGSLTHFQIAAAGTQQIAKNLDNPVPHSWVNHAVSWNPPSDLQDSQVLLAIERCRPEIMKFLDSLLGKRIDVRGTFTVESAASAVVAAAMGRKIAGQIQVSHSFDHIAAHLVI